MTNFATMIAAAIFTFGAMPTAPADAAPAPMLDSVAPAAEQAAQVAYLCEYVILWDAWGNAYFEYVCY
jgi:hypothetical protein